MQSILVVGAGLAGAVYARTLAEAGYSISVIDRRPHVAGNCFDEVDACGVRVHRYGPHLFHTNMHNVVEWLSQFTAWEPYEHRVVARLGGGAEVPMPINLGTVNAVFGREFRTDAEVREFLETIVIRRGAIVSAQDYLFSIVGKDLTDLFFRPYTKKMWGYDLSEMDRSVVERLKIDFGSEDRYFPGDAFQALPKDGYTTMFDRILDHPEIKIILNTAFNKNMLGEHAFCFNSMPIDEFFDYEFGDLAYRSIKFHSERAPMASASAHPVVNYTDEGPFTRETWWHNLPGATVASSGTVVRTIEEPCDYKENAMERYYPVRTHDGRFQAQYQRYKALAEQTPGIEFIGRCGTYQYLDMHQVVSQSLTGVRKWLAAQRS